MTTREPACLFLLWNAFPRRPAGVSFDVTRANVPRVGRPEPGWLAAALRALDIAGSPRRSDVTAARSSYFSDYLEEDEPENRWPDCWTIQATLVEGYPAEPRPRVAPVGLAALDGSWDGARDPAHDERALLVAVGDKAAAADVLGDALASVRRERLEPPSAAVIACAGGLARIRLTVPCTFPQDIGSLETVTERLKRAGWATDWRSALDL